MADTYVTIKADALRQLGESYRDNPLMPVVSDYLIRGGDTIDGLEDLVRAMWLSVGLYAETQLTTEQKELLYDVANPTGARWWRE